MTQHPVAARRALHLIAIFEALKGLAALAVAFGLVDLAHRDVRRLALALIGRFGLDPVSRYPSLLLHYADLLPGVNVSLVLALAAAYILIRFAEAYGLWKDLAWGEWVGALSGALYIPFELRHMLHRPSWITAVVLLANVLVTAFLAYQLFRRRKRRLV